MQIECETGQMSLFDQDSLSGKMSPVPTQAAGRKARTSTRSSNRSSRLKNHTLMLLDLRKGAGNMLGPCWETDPPWLGEPGTLNTSECPKDVVVSSLSQILLAIAPLKYYLSKKACRGMLRRASERGKSLPPELEKAVKIQAGITKLTKLPKPPLAFHINQREETIDLGETAGALMATTNMQMQTFVASFNAGAGPGAGGIGYHTQLSPTLKSAECGQMAPAILCINDQGGQVIDCSEEISGTLRAQEHGHQPLVFENHGIDSRYTGPHSVAPTMSARYGTGGNNIPLVSDSLTVFNRQRLDTFKAEDIASTQSARQYKDATDLICQPTYQTTVGALTSSDHKGPNNQYVSQDKCVIDQALLIRRLMPIECERLQGFPDGWTDLPGASDSARYKALGNSVAIPCVDYLMQGISLASQITAPECRYCLDNLEKPCDPNHCKKIKKGRINS